MRAREAVSVSDTARVLPWSQDEVEFVTELQGGSGAAFDWLVTHYSGPVYGLVAGMVSESSDAADITQDVFLKAFRGIRGFRRGSSLKTWLYRIAVREALNHRRWLWRHHREQDSIDIDPMDGHAMIEIEDERSTPFDQAASHEVQQAVQRALLSVPEVFRSAVILRDLEGMAYEEVAEVLSVSVGTVKSRILRGRRLLREILEPVLRNPQCAHAAAHTAKQHHQGRQHQDQGESILHSTLFSSVVSPTVNAEENVTEKKSSGRSDTIGWAYPGKPGDAEGGV
jgi:RNA polymerase sigma-70 factor (ECF subfamily)